MEDKEGKGSLLLNGITESQKDYLYKYAKNHLGCRSRTKAILHLIDKDMGLAEAKSTSEIPTISASKKRQRIQISLLPEDYLELEKRAKILDSSMQYYIISLILKDLYNVKRLNGLDYEVLRKSNYQLHKIGVNINQIAKALNEGREVGFDVEPVTKMLEEHIEKVKNILSDDYMNR